MVDRLPPNQRLPISICEPNHQAAVPAAEEQFRLLQSEWRAEDQGLSFDPQSTEASSQLYFPRFQMPQIFSLRSRQWDKLDASVQAARFKTQLVYSPDFIHNPTTRASYQRELLSFLLGELTSPGGLALAYDTELEEGLRTQEALEQQRGVCRELSYTFLLQARQAGFNAFFLGVDEYADGRSVYEVGLGHLLVGVLLSDGSVLQVDPTSGTVGSNHCRVHFVSDAEATSEFFNTQAGEAVNQKDDYLTYHRADQALEFDPSNHQAQIHLLRTADFESEDDAIATWLNLGETYPQDFDVQLAVAYFLNDKTPSLAITHYDQAQSLVPTPMTEVHIGKAHAYQSMGAVYTDQVILSYLTALDHPPLNPYDTYLLQIYSEQLLNWLTHDKRSCEKLTLNYQGQELDYDAMLQKARELQTRHQIPLEKLPEIAQWLLFERGDFDAAEYCVLKYFYQWGIVFEPPERIIAMARLKGEIAYRKGFLDSAKSLWTKEPYRQGIWDSLLQEIRTYGWPGTPGYFKATRAAERLYLIDPENPEVQEFVALKRALAGEENIAIPETEETLLLRQVVAAITNHTLPKTSEPLGRFGYFLEYSYLEQGDLEHLRALDDTDFHREYTLNNNNIPLTVLAAHEEKLAKFFSAQNNPADQARAIKYYAQAMSQLRAKSDHTVDFNAFKFKLVELSRAQAALEKDFSFVDQNVLSHLFSEHLRWNKPISEDELSLYTQAYEDSVAKLSAVDARKIPRHRSRLRQVFENQVVATLYSIRAEDTLNPEVLQVKAEQLTTTLETKRKLYQQHKLRFEPWSEQEQVVVLYLYCILPLTQGAAPHEVFAQYPPEFQQVLKEVVRATNLKTNEGRIGKAIFLWMSDPEKNQSAIHQLLQEVAEATPNSGYFFPEDILEASGPVPIPKIDEILLPEFNAAYFQAAQTLAHQIGRDDLVFQE